MRSILPGSLGFGSALSGALGTVPTGAAVLLATGFLLIGLLQAVMPQRSNDRLQLLLALIAARRPHTPPPESATQPQAPDVSLPDDEGTAEERAGRGQHQPARAPRRQKRPGPRPRVPETGKEASKP